MQVKTLLLSALVLLLLCGVSFAWPADQTGALRKLYSVNNSMFNEPLTDFKYPIRLNSSNFDFTKANVNGSNICFYTLTDGIIWQETERYNYTAQQGAFWIKLNVSNTTYMNFSFTKFFMYYNGTTNCTHENKTQLWTDYDFVHHLSETSGPHNDSTLNYNSTAITVTEQGNATGILGGADNLTGLDSVSWGDVLDPAPGGTLNLEVWYKPNMIYGDGVELFGKRYVYEASQYAFNDKLCFAYQTAGPTDQIYCANTAQFYNNTWAYFAFTFTYGTGTSAKLYVNGTLVPGAWGWGTGNVNAPINAEPLMIHSPIYLSGQINGTVDEIRISTTAKNASWINATWQTLAGITGTWGTEENETNATSPYFVYIGDCGIGNPILNFTFRNEENDTNIFLKHDNYFEVFYANGSFIANDSATIFSNTSSFCMYTDTNETNFLIDSFQSYGSATNETLYPRRNYFLLNAPVVYGILSNFTLYSENSTFAKQTSIKVMTSVGYGQPNVYVSINRYFPETGNYKTVAMIITDSDGVGTTFLKQYEFYRFVVYGADGIVMKVTEPEQVSCDPASSECFHNIQIDEQGTGLTWQYYGKIAHTCTNYTAITGNMYLACYWTDTSGLFHNFTLRVAKYSMNYSAVECLNTSTGSTGVVTCSFSNSTNGYYTYVFSGDINPNTDFESGYYWLGQNADFGMVGLVITGVLVVVFACIGIMMNSAPLVVIGANIGLILASVMGFVSIAAGALGFLLIIGIIVMFYSKRD